MFFRVLIVFTVLNPSLSYGFFDQLEALQDIKVGQGLCQQDWRGLSGDLRSGTKVVSDSQIVIFLPCALWAVNFSSTAYLVTEAPGLPGGVLIQSLSFLQHRHGRGLFGSSVVHNMRWDDQDTLYSRFYFKQRALCGNMIQYRWDAAQQVFVATKLLGNADCESPVENWKPLLSPVD